MDDASKEELLRLKGAYRFLDYRKLDGPPDDQRFDVIISMIARSPYSRYVASLNVGGTYMMANPRLSDIIRSIWTSRSSNTNVVTEFAPESRDDMLALRGMVEAGEIRSVLPIEKIVEAHVRVEREQRLGSVVVIVP